MELSVSQRKVKILISNVCLLKNRKLILHIGCLTKVKNWESCTRNSARLWNLSDLSVSRQYDMICDGTSIWRDDRMSNMDQ